MATIGLVVRSGEDAVRKSAQAVSDWARARGHEIRTERQSVLLLEWKQEGWAAEELLLTADPVVVLGGDGTMIKVARHVGAKSPVLIGVNFGTLGFLTEVAPAELLSVLERCLKHTCPTTSRTMLYCQVLRGAASILSSQVVNDVVVQKGLRGRLVDFDVYVNEEEVMRLRADGVIFSTPTGSTAYSLAAGGSIVHPDLAALLVTPICAHSLTNRPLILPLDVKLDLVVPQHEGEVLVVIDGQESLLLQAGDRVFITRAKHTVSFVRSLEKSYFGILRSKLHWGVVNHAD